MIPRDPIAARMSAAARFYLESRAAADAEPMDRYGMGMAYGATIMWETMCNRTGDDAESLAQTLVRVTGGVRNDA